MMQHACKYVSLSLWPCVAFSELKITTILKSSGWELKKSELPWEQLCFLTGKTISLPSFNSLHCKLAKIAVCIYLIKYWVDCHLHIIYTLFKLNISGTNADICKP